MISINVLNNVGGTILSIVLFLVALGVLVIIHELGHFIAAKSFKVYCSDFSIGFGPKIVNVKRKKGETRFSIGILPLGGYVSMLGEEDNDATLDDGTIVPDSRTLNGISRWKRIIIMAAGIIMNFVLAYIIFFICASCFEQVAPTSMFYDVDTEISKTHLVDESGQFSTNDYICYTPYEYNIENGNATWKLQPDVNKNNQMRVMNLMHKGYLTLDGSDDKYVAVLSFVLNNGVNNTDLSRYVYFFKTVDTPDANGYYMPIVSEKGEFSAFQPSVETKGSSFTVPFEYYNYVGENDPVLDDLKDKSKKIPFEEASGKYKTYNANLKFVVNEEGIFERVGVSYHKFNYWNGWNSFGEAGKNWVDSTSAITNALGGLFVGQGWENVGGPLAIFNRTTNVLENNPFYFYLQTWGTISVNLALFNLLPFPGLDGWQILVELVEGGVNGTKKSIYYFKKRKASNKKENQVTDENLTDTQPVVDVSENQVTTNKNVNITIGENQSDDYKEWKIPAQLKTIMSYVGLGLLFAFMIAVIIMDIMKMV